MSIPSAGVDTVLHGLQTMLAEGFYWLRCWPQNLLLVFVAYLLLACVAWREHKRAKLAGEEFE